MNIITTRPVISEESSNASGKLKSMFKKKELTPEQQKLKQEESDKRKKEKSDIYDERVKNKNDRKAKRNTRALKRVKTRFGNRWVLSIPKVFKGKKINPDGTKSDVAKEDTITDSKGNSYDKKDVGNAVGKSPESVTQSDVDKNITSSDTSPSGTSDIIVEDKNVTQTDNGLYFTNSDTQPSSEPQLDKKLEDEKSKNKGKTVKIVLISLGVVAVISIVAVIYQLSNKNVESK